MSAPKILHQIWIGDKPAPTKWMKTWHRKNPDWEYKLWDNEAIKKFDFRNKEHIQHYWDKKLWHGVADLIRYEVLYTYGGYMPGADSECLRKLGDLFDDPDYLAYTCYVSERRKPGIVAPLMACNKHNELARLMIEGIHNKPTMVGKSVWKMVGNRYMTNIIKYSKYKKIKIFPSHYFIPEDMDGEMYQGLDKPYAYHHWGTTRGDYKKGV